MNSDEKTWRERRKGQTLNIKGEVMGKDLQDCMSSAGQTKRTLRRTWMNLNGWKKIWMKWEPQGTSGHPETVTLENISTGVSHPRRVWQNSLFLKKKKRKKCPVLTIKFKKKKRRMSHKRKKNRLYVVCKNLCENFYSLGGALLPLLSFPPAGPFSLWTIWQKQRRSERFTLTGRSYTRVYLHTLHHGPACASLRVM